MGRALYADAFATHEVVRLAALTAPTGQLVACDPYFCASAEPFERVVEPGEYDVELCVVPTEDWGLRVALARVVVDPGRSEVAYEAAVKEPSGSNTYAVDSGVGSFLDLETRAVFADVLARHYERDPAANYYTDVLAAEFKRNARDPANAWDVGRWALHTVPGSELTVALFSSGLGDGFFQSYWGLDESGAVTSLVTDFGLL